MLHQTVRIAMLAATALGAAVVPACQSARPAGRCDVAYRFENVRRDDGGGADEWTEITKVLNRYAEGPVPPPKTSDLRRLPGAEVRTCEVMVGLPSVGDLAKVESDLQAMAESHAVQRRLEFSLSRASMTYRSNFIGADLEVTLHGVTNPGFDVFAYTSPGDERAPVRAGRGGAWTMRLASVPAGRYVYGYSRDPDRVIRNRFFRIDMSTMRQEPVAQEQFQQATGVDPDRPVLTAPGRATAPRAGSARDRAAGDGQRDDSNWYKDPRSDQEWNRRDGDGRPK